MVVYLDDTPLNADWIKTGEPDVIMDGSTMDLRYRSPGGAVLVVPEVIKLPETSTDDNGVVATIERVYARDKPDWEEGVERLAFLTGYYKYA